MQSLSARILCTVLKAVFHSPLMRSKSHSASAARKIKKMKSRYKPSKGFSVSRHSCAEAFYEKLVFQDSKCEKVVFHLHGGGFRMGMIDMYKKFAEKYSRMLGGATVITVDYRLFPEFRFPSQLDDSVAVYKEIISQGVKPENVVFIGDSSGANLAVTTALYLRDNGCPLPSGIVCFSFWGDATSSGESRERNAYKDPIYGIPKSEKIEDSFEHLHRISDYAKALDRENPYVSPCFADFEGFPPVTLVCGGAEVDESDSDRVFDKLKKLGIDAELYKFDGMFHCFQLVPFLPESRQAYRLVTERINKL